MVNRTFTLRLTQEENEALKLLKAIVNEKSDSKIIRYVIKRFKPVLDELTGEKLKNEQLNTKLAEIKEKVNAFNEAMNGLKELK